jgi:hypothetical protein
MTASGMYITYLGNDAAGLAPAYFYLNLNIFLFFIPLFLPVGAVLLPLVLCGFYLLWL